MSSLPPATKLGQGYIFTGVCDSFHRGVCLSACWDTIPQTPRDQATQDQAPPGTRHPQPPTLPGAGTPDQAHPPDQTPPRSGTTPRTEHAGRYSQRAGGTYPTGMQSCLKK